MRPSLRRAATVAAVTLGALTLGASGLGAPSLGAAGPSGTAGAQAERVTSEQVEEDLAWLINQRRAQAGLAPLLLAPTVRAPARRWAEAQAAAGKISHRADLSPYPATVPGLAWSLTGENVGHAGSARSGGPAIMTALDQAFYDSPTHRDNVLGPYTHLAVGAVDDGRDLYVTVAFVDWNGASVDGQRLPTSALHDTVGALDSVGGEEGGVRLVGWVADPDAAPTAEVTIDGRARTVAPTEVRPDLASVAGAAPDLANGLNTLLPAPPGPTEVCVDGPPVGFGAGLSLGCRNVLVPQGWDGLVGAGDDAATVGYVASGLLPGAERPAKPTGEPGTTAQPGTSAKPAGEPEPADRPTWGTIFPATLQRYRADGGGGASPVFADPFGRLHWRGPDGAKRVARPPAGQLAPGRPPVDLGDVDGDGVDDLVMLVRLGSSWALTGFADADPAKPLPVTKRPDLDGWTAVQLSVAPQRRIDGRPTVRSGPLRVTAGTIVAGHRKGDGPLVASIGGREAVEIGPTVAPAGAVSDVEWVELDGDALPDAVVVDRQPDGDGSRVRLLMGVDSHRSAAQTVTVPGQPVDLEPR